MSSIIFCIILAAVLSALIILQRTYNAVPLKELKRHARKGDDLAKLLYRVVAYGSSLRLVVWALIGLTSAGLFLLIAHITTSGLALVIITGLILIGYVWFPAGTAGPYGAWLARRLTPPLLWLLERLHPVLDVFNNFVQRYRHVNLHTGIYEKEDILDLIARQQTQTDSRISKEELDIAWGALTFGEKLVRDIMVPARMIKSVKADDSIGPILMDELHDSGISRFPVTNGGNKSIIGTLYLRDLVGLTNGGKIRDVMDKKVCYVNEAATLDHVLEAFLKTHHHLFVVVNEFEETVGIITIEDILEQILGKQIVGEFDEYENLRAVAAHQAHKEKVEHAEVSAEVIE